jgi:hypothetical protein
MNRPASNLSLLLGSLIYLTIERASGVHPTISTIIQIILGSILIINLYYILKLPGIKAKLIQLGFLIIMVILGFYFGNSLLG